MKRKSGIAAIILSGAIVFAVAGDIRPVSATVSGLPAENSVSSSEYTDSSSNDLEQLKKTGAACSDVCCPANVFRGRYQQRGNDEQPCRQHRAGRLYQGRNR